MNNVMIGLSEAMGDHYNPTVVITGWSQPLPGQLSVKLPAPQLPIRNLLGFFLRFLPNLVRLRRLVRNAVAVNPHFFGPEILPLVVLRKLGLAPKLILSVHGADVRHAMQATGIERRLFSLIYRSADLVIACSRSLASDVISVSPRARVTAVLNGTSPVPETSAERPIPEPYLISVAGFVKKKGHDVLLQAFEEVARRFPRLKLVLIGGNGPERDNIAGYIRDRGLQSKVEMLVDLPQEQVWSWVKHAECFVLASREEPFGIAILEAALVRTPVVTTAVGGIPEFLTSGVHGLTCPPDQPAELARTIIETLSDKSSARARSDTFYSHARTFTWDSAWQQYKRLLGLR